MSLPREQHGIVKFNFTWFAFGGEEENIFMEEKKKRGRKTRKKEMKEIAAVWNLLQGLECSLIWCVLQGEGKQRRKGAKEVYDTVLKSVRRMQLSEMHSSVTKIECTLLSVLHRQIHLRTRALEAIFILFKCLKLSLLELRWFCFSARMWGSVFKHIHSAPSYFACICEWSSQTWYSVQKYTLW